MDALLRVPFEGEAEARLVHALRKAGALAGEMVLPDQEGEIVGYYGLSEMKAPSGWLCLAPVAIHPEWQGQGHGRRMIGQLAAWAVAAQQYLVVLGQVDFYAACGFSHSRAAQLESPYPAEHMLLAGPGEDVPKGTLKYPAPFERL